MVSIPERYIVGWDGSPGASAALDWALAQARGTHTKVHLLHAVLAIPPGPYGEVALDQGVYDDIAQAVLALGIDYAKEHAPDVTVTTERAYRGVTGALMDAARPHDVIVLGTRGYGGFMTMIVESSCIQAATHAQVPVVVVHPREKGQPSYASAGPVVIAIDGTDLSKQAMQFGLMMASLLHREAIVIHTWTLPAVEIVPPSFIAADEAAAIASDQQRIASEFLAGWRTEFPDVKVTMRVIQGNTAAVLLEAAKTASLVVTGSRGRGEFRGAFLGSTSNALIHHAGCPVAIVRTEKPVVVKSQAAAA